MGVSPNWELELVVPCIILESKEEGETQMATNLRVDFKERQRKRLFEALSTLLPPAKKTRPEVSRDEPVLDAPMV